jgi:hypothetical protein
MNTGMKSEAARAKLGPVLSDHELLFADLRSSALICGEFFLRLP